MMSVSRLSNAGVVKLGEMQAELLRRKVLYNLVILNCRLILSKTTSKRRITLFYHPLPSSKPALLSLYVALLAPQPAYRV
jgi:hypothetical protein